MISRNSKAGLVVRQLARIEKDLLRLKEEFRSATFQKSTLVEELIAQSEEELKDAFNEMMEGTVDASKELADVVFLRVTFARKLFEGDVSEHLLGEDDFLNLDRDAVSSEKLLIKYFNQLTHLIGRMKLRIGAHRG